MKRLSTEDETKLKAAIEGALQDLRDAATHDEVIGWLRERNAWVFEEPGRCASARDEGQVVYALQEPLFERVGGDDRVFHVESTADLEDLSHLHEELLFVDGFSEDMFRATMNIQEPNEDKEGRRRKVIHSVSRLWRSWLGVLGRP